MAAPVPAARVILLPVSDNEASDAALAFYLANVHRAGDFVQLLLVTGKMETGIDELLHTDIRMKAEAINAPAADFVFERFAPKLASASIDHRVGVLRCSTGARSVGDVIVKNAAVINANLIVMACEEDKSMLSELVTGSASSIAIHRAPCPVLVCRGLTSEVKA